MLCWEEKHEKKKKRSSCTQLIRKAGHHKDDNTKMLYLDLGIFNSPKLRSYFLIVVLDCCCSCERKHCKLIWAGSFRKGGGGGEGMEEDNKGKTTDRLAAKEVAPIEVCTT